MFIRDGLLLASLLVFSSHYSGRSRMGDSYALPGHWQRTHLCSTCLYRPEMPTKAMPLRPGDQVYNFPSPPHFDRVAGHQTYHKISLEYVP
ncbi:hypothetical protein B9Z19DRAFT_1085888 [Tuber borchii]|uniref:Secreted protein n=1 Tax=Tuber borchii TaxID=42251 RepID=A0A2T6ZQ80_TUBBO|nr:hypothetical protein B9Z19DRAFT_1085888 [Tuber borchii]